MHGPRFPYDHLCVAHYHWRPGGVRRVVELTLPEIVRAAGPGLKKATLLAGGSPHERPQLSQLGIDTIFVHEPACDYFSTQSETPAAIATKIRAVLHQAMPEADASKTLIWFQNPALARNALLCREIAEFSRQRGASLILHHHDFWCAGRWARWEELKRCGCESLSEAADCLFADQTRSVHVGINWPDFQTLDRSLSGRAFHLTNPVAPPLRMDEKSLIKARAWLADELKTDGPLWIYPTRFLRRKNILEAILIARWMRPEATLATTSGQFSSDEASYADDIKQAAKKNAWKVHFGLLDNPGAPSVAEILGIAEAAVHTSVQEGFGMGFVEAAAAGTPLIARAIPDVMPDLHMLGFEFPNLYRDIFIAPELFDIPTEAQHQANLFHEAKLALPPTFQEIFPSPPTLGDDAIPFSRLSRRAQLEVLSHPAAWSWEICKSLNPDLEKFRTHPLQPTPWPKNPVQTPAHYAATFLEISAAIPTRAVDHRQNAAKTQMELTARALKRESIFPIQLEK